MYSKLGIGWILDYLPTSRFPAALLAHSFPKGLNFAPPPLNARPPFPLAATLSRQQRYRGNYVIAATLLSLRLREILSYRSDSIGIIPIAIAEIPRPDIALYNGKDLHLNLISYQFYPTF